MTSEAYTNRIVNGLLKADVGLRNPDEVESRLSRDVVLRVDPLRSSESDLWPCIWFLASILERQFFGKIFISGVEAPLCSPVPLGSRCVFVASDFFHDGLEIGIGTPIKGIWGDVKGNTIAYGRQVDGTACATPLAGSVLAGYLGFAALADSAGIPPFHQTLVEDSLELPL